MVTIPISADTDKIRKNIIRGIIQGVREALKEFLPTVAKDTGQLQHAVQTMILNQVIGVRTADSVKIEFNMSGLSTIPYAKYHVVGPDLNKYYSQSSYSNPTTQGTKPINPSALIKLIKQKIALNIKGMFQAKLPVEEVKEEKKKIARTKTITSSQLLIILNKYITLNSTILIDELVLKKELKEFTIASIKKALEDLQEDEFIDGSHSRSGIGKLALFEDSANYTRILLRKKGLIEEEPKKDVIVKEKPKVKEEAVKLIPVDKWIDLKEEDLLKELRKYSVSELRSKASIYLKSTDKALTDRKKLEIKIIRGVKELISFANLGKHAKIPEDLIKEEIIAGSIIGGSEKRGFYPQQGADGIYYEFFYNEDGELEILGLYKVYDPDETQIQMSLAEIKRRWNLFKLIDSR